MSQTGIQPENGILAAPGVPDPAPARAARRPKHVPQRRFRNTSIFARGEPMVWLTGGAVVSAMLMILLLLGYIMLNGFTTFWPLPLEQLRLKNGEVVLGEPTREEVFTGADAGGNAASIRRILYKTGNYDVTGQDFTWVNVPDIAEKTLPEWGLVVERQGWGNAYGALQGIIVDGKTIVDPAAAWARFQEVHGPIRRRLEEIRHIEKEEMGVVAREQNRLRLALRMVEMESGSGSDRYREKAAEVAGRQQALDRRFAELRDKVSRIRTEVDRARIVIRSSGGQIIPADRSKPDEPLFAWQVVRAYPANQLGAFGKLQTYFSRWGEYLLDDPREANTEGGVFPAIFGTVLLTFIMILFVVPIGVVASIYLREYARPGILLSIVRISVNNLAGVPSIVFGVFGLGFFCYMVGGSIDRWFFAASAAEGTPVLGKSAMIWASLTLSLLTLPVVIVATEEALAAVPRSMREGSYACGASKWQTIRRIVLPRAMPGIMTGMILAIARGAGEVAPLMLVGAVKMAPELPFSTSPGELFGINRSFMHLGFHVFDLGFQSRNSEAAKSMVYTTTFLLIAIVVALNLAAMLIRTRLRRAYAGGHF